MDKSYLTAKTRKILSAPMRYLCEKGLITGRSLDYGSGRGDDADRLEMDKYDPHFQSILLNKKYKTITCNYVLNIIESPQERQKVLRKIKKLLMKGGTTYISVRRDKMVEGYTSWDTYQAYVTLNLPVLVEKKSRFIIYILRK